MSDQSQEPTMEEILASIRRIISEDDAPAEPAAEAAPPPPEPEPEPEPVSFDDDVLELTDPITPEPELPPLETVGDIDIYSPPEPEPEPAYTPPPAAPVFDRDEVADQLVGVSAASAAASAFGSLSSALLMPKDGRTLEDVVRELLRPLLKEWLDQNLPRIVETKVEEEVQRISRGRGA
ncbi:pole-organizing protein PopZ [Caulobacter sp. BE264]|uniref:pole-organizing protein PopZ n=1 Tax=Caulobacter sp. BE264 TaxID=2817724 RepID=UPI00286C86B0|nr:pole-organizing protein PopZ [Caulobacter sp. BE264]